MKTLAPLTLIGFLAAALSVSAADAKDSVKAAAQKLGAKSYRYVSTPKSEGGGSRFQTGPTEGQVEKDGYAYLSSKAGDNTIEAYLKDGKGAVKTQDGWRSLAELQQSAQGGGGGKGKGGAGLFIGRAYRNYKAPDRQAADLADKAKQLKDADGVISGELTEEGAKEQLSFGGRSGGQAPQVEGAKGSVKFWVKNGELAKYEIHVQGKVSFGGNDIDINRTTTVEIKEGPVKVSVPDEAKAKL
jgi:hypothetical protein